MKHHAVCLRQLSFLSLFRPIASFGHKTRTQSYFCVVFTHLHTTRIRVFRLSWYA